MEIVDLLFPWLQHYVNLQAKLAIILAGHENQFIILRAQGNI